MTMRLEFFEVHQITPTEPTIGCTNTWMVHLGLTLGFVLLELFSKACRE